MSGRQSISVALRASIAVTAASVAGVALAQEPAGSVGASTERVTPEGLTEVIVTAQRREENLQRTALAVSVVDAQQLTDAGVSDVTELTKLVPSLVVQPATGTSVAFYLRGVGSFVGNAFTENPVAFNYNQIYIARPAALLGSFYDLERVEVLKGPQGTLYGRNATGGAINVIPKRPQLGELSGEATLEVGNYDARRGQAAINLPLGDAFALRVAGLAADRDGYLSDGYDDEHGQAVRVSLLAEPHERISAVVVADYFQPGGNGPGGVLVPGALVPSAPDVDERIGGADSRSIAALQAAFPALIGPGLVAPPRDDGFVDSKFWGVSANIDIDLDFATLTVIPGYRDSRPDYLAYNGGYASRVHEVARQKSLEIRLASNATGPFQYVVGGYYFDEDQSALNDFTQGLLLRTRFAVGLDNESQALFGQATYEILPDFRLLAGVRYSHEDKTQDTTLQQSSFGVGPTTQTAREASFEKVTWKAGVEWDVSLRNLLYANVATGFKSGGFFVAALDNTFEPEEITAYTLGSKNRFVDNRLQLNVEAFYWDYKDQQINYVGPIRTGPATIGSGLVTTNAGSSRIYGAEAELSLQLTPNDLFAANVQYLNGEYTDFKYLAASPNGAPPRTNCAVAPTTSISLPPPGRGFMIDCSGKEQINTPDWSVNLSFEHTFDISSNHELMVGARTKIETSRYLLPEYLPEEQQDSYTQSDAYLTLRSADNWSLTAFINNIEDETVYAGSSLRPVVPVVYNILRAPRTYGLRAGFQF